MHPIYSRGIYLPALDLWLDSTAQRESSFISHAHADHVARHSRAILSRSTVRLLQPLLDRREPRWLEFGEPMETSKYTLTLYPAGHMLGSAQVLIESKGNGERILYTGDIKLQANPAAEPVQAVSCDTLITEATYGRAHYTFPPQEEVVTRLVAKLREWLAQGEVPVVLGYRLGKAQELLHYLLAHGFEVAVEGSTWEACLRYEESGINFTKGYRRYDGTLREGEVLLFPPSQKHSDQLQKMARRRLILLTGWAMNRNAVQRFGVDEILPLSDHADYQGLLKYVKLVSPKRVYTVNGFPDLATHLRKMGYEAYHLSRKDGEGAQLPLF